MHIINKNQIDNGLEKEHRIYLCGNLGFPSPSPHIATDGYEIGITHYKEYTCEKPHYHTINTEYNYVISGSLKILDIDNNKEYLLNSGDFFVIEPNQKYITKALADTSVIFSKTPGGNDKNVINTDKNIIEWGEKW